MSFFWVAGSSARDIVMVRLSERQTSACERERSRRRTHAGFYKKNVVFQSREYGDGGGNIWREN